MTILAFITVAVVVGTWLGIRIADARQRIERIDRDLTAYLLSIPADEWKSDE